MRILLDSRQLVARSSEVHSVTSPALGVTCPK